MAGASNYTPNWYAGYLRLAALLLVLFLAAGVFQAFILPPFQAPDEAAHWWTATAQKNADGKLACTVATWLPLHFQFNEVNFRKEARAPHNKFAQLNAVQPRCYQETVSYAGFWSYPQVLLSALLVPQDSSLPRQALLVFYLARLLSGFVIAALLLRLLQLFRNQRRAPLFGLLSLLGLTLSPLFLQQAFSVTSDMVVIAFTLVLTSFLLFWGRLTWFDGLLFAVFGVAAAATKPVLLPAALGVFIYNIVGKAPALRLRSLVWPRLLSPEGAAMAALPFMAAAAVSTVLMTIAASGPSPDGRIVDSAEQMRFIVTHPFTAGWVLNKAIAAHLNFNTLSQPLGWMDTPISAQTFYIWSALVALLFAADMTCAVRLGLQRWRERWVPSPITFGVAAIGGAAGFYGTALAIVLSLYLGYTTVGWPYVQGLQGRYFFPVAMLEVVLLMDFLAVGRAAAPAAPAFLSLGSLWRWLAQGALVLLIAYYLCTLFLDLAARYY